VVTDSMLLEGVSLHAPKFGQTFRKEGEKEGEHLQK
jgi:hypothetical protein